MSSTINSKKKKNLESSTTSLHSVTKDPKTEYLSKTVKRVNLATHEVKERINFNSPLHNVDIYKNNRNKQTNSKSNEKNIKMIPNDGSKNTFSNISNKVNDLNLPLKKKNDQFNTIHIKSPTKNFIPKQKNEQERPKVMNTLQEKIAMLEKTVAQYKVEKTELRKQLNQIANDENLKKIEKLENEIGNYKNTSNVYLQTCSKLAEEIIVLRRELEKYMTNTVKKSDL